MYIYICIVAGIMEYVESDVLGHILDIAVKDNNGVLLTQRHQVSIFTLVSSLWNTAIHSNARLLSHLVVCLWSDDIDKFQLSTCHTWWRKSNIDSIILTKSSIGHAIPNSTRLKGVTVTNATQLTNVRADFSALFPGLLELSFQSCYNLVTFAESLNGLQHLTDLNLSGCTNICELHQDFSSLCNLQVLNISFASKLANNSEFYFTISRILTLRELCLNGCKMQTVPSAISLLINLKKLIMNGCCNLTVLGGDILKLTNLEELYLRSAYISELPKEFGGKCMSKMRVLDLAWNTNLKAFPDSLSENGNLQSSSSNGESYLQRAESVQHMPSLLEMASLTALNISHCIQLESIPILPAQLRSLDLSFCKNATVTQNVFTSLTQLIELRMSGCDAMVSNLDMWKQMSSIKTIQILDISKCAFISSLPCAIFQFLDLRTLNASSCVNVLTIPNGICRLTALESLDLSGCVRLEHFPHTFASLIKLKELKVRMCNVLVRYASNLEMIAALSSLQCLEIHCKRIEEGIGKYIECLTSRDNARRLLIS